MNNGNLEKNDKSMYGFNKADGLDSPLEKLSTEAGKKIGELASGFSHSASEYIQTGKSFVRANPAKSIAIAASAGIVAGSVLTMILNRKN